MSTPISTRRSFLVQTAAGLATAATIQFARATSGTASNPESPMKTCKMPHTDLVVSRIAYGWAGGEWDKSGETVSAATLAKASRAIHAAYDNGITFFDTADIYALGKSEAAFGAVLKQSAGLRNKIVIQSKCGIHISWPMSEPPPGDPHRFD